MLPRLLCQLCHLPGGGEVLLENATPTAVPPVPPGMGGEVLLENATPTAVPPVPPAMGGEVLLENATPTAVPPVPPARGGEVLLERETTRGQPKDGAFLLSSCGYRIMCAARACCWKMPGCPE